MRRLEKPLIYKLDDVLYPVYGKQIYLMKLEDRGQVDPVFPSELVLVKGDYFTCLIDSRKAPPLMDFYNTGRYVVLLGIEENERVAVYDQIDDVLYYFPQNVLPLFVLLHVEAVLNCPEREQRRNVKTCLNPHIWLNYAGQVTISCDSPMYVSKLGKHYFEISWNSVLYMDISTGETLEVIADFPIAFERACYYEEKVILPLLEGYEMHVIDNGKYILYRLRNGREYMLYRAKKWKHIPLNMPYPYNNIVL